MALLEAGEREVLEAFARLANTNPFLPERVAAERAALGEAFVRTSAVWHVETDLNGINPNVPKLGELAARLAGALRERLAAGTKASAHELGLYQLLVLYLLYERYEQVWFGLLVKGIQGKPTTKPVAEWKRFRTDVESYFASPDRAFPESSDPTFLFALGFQMRRAFHHTFRQIYGGSMPAARLRANVWQSIFTYDPARYRRDLAERMGDVPVLVVGESGTGKELVARAIAFSRFIPFDPDRGAFVADWAGGFHGLNPAALSPTLVESELFGHRRGAFTGAIEDREGWLAAAGPYGTVFLDEIGELDPAIQVKLLRVLQTRRFERIGETQERRFEGRIVAATNRDLAAEMQAGRFRPDLYYRLCADVVETPTLREQLGGEESELRSLVSILARRMVAAEEAPRLTDEVVACVRDSLGLDYAWPGNVRELEQCVRSVLVRGSYRPAAPGAGAARGPLEALAAGTLSADEMLRVYVTHVYARVGSYEAAARRLGLDRRTVKAKLDPELLEALRAAR